MKWTLLSHPWCFDVHLPLKSKWTQSKHAFVSRRICPKNHTESLRHSERPPPGSKVITQTAAPAFYFDGSTVSVNDTKQYPVLLFVVEPSWPWFVSKCWVYLPSIQGYALLHSVKQGRIQLHGGQGPDKSSLLFQSPHRWIWGWGEVALQSPHCGPPEGNEAWGGAHKVVVVSGTDRHARALLGQLRELYLKLLSHKRHR